VFYWSVILLIGGTIPAAAQAVPRTPEGKPDLQGIWDFRTATPLERPLELRDQEFLTEQSRAAVERRAAERLRVQSPDDPLLNTPPWWLDYGSDVVRTRRSSLIVDPPDGRLPPLTIEGARRQNALLAARDAAEGPEGLSPWDRCITKGVPASMLPGAQNNNLQIVQTPGYIVIMTEMIHEARIVPLDPWPSLPGRLGLWTGVSRGRWEGATLVVETTNFSDESNFLGAAGGLRMVERLTRIDANTLDYRLTIDDPAMWTKRWTVAIPFVRSDGPLYEYACHEGNYSMRNTLMAARAAESAIRQP
jgi:hypothetical protein